MTFADVGTGLAIASALFYMFAEDVAPSKYPVTKQLAKYLMMIMMVVAVFAQGIDTPADWSLAVLTGVVSILIVMLWFDLLFPFFLALFGKMKRK